MKRFIGITVSLFKANPVIQVKKGTGKWIFQDRLIRRKKG
jgi:hypothetical protein